MKHFRKLAGIRRDYGELSLSEDSMQTDPFDQFKRWFEDVLQNEKNDPTAMVLSTVDANGLPDSRVVLLKGIHKGQFLFYTNYESRKGRQLKLNPNAALNFYWPQMARQVRVRGIVKKTSKAVSDDYFSKRPLTSQLSAIISPQSREIANRSVLETSLNELIGKHRDIPVERPSQWGGYMLYPEEIEFWQGRDNRLHDRIQYYRSDKSWLHCRLAP